MSNPSKPNYTRSFIVVTSLFFMWGFITVLVDSLIPRLKEIFELTYFQAGLVQFAFFLAYGLFSIPAGSVLSKIGYKRGMLLGLATMGVGCLLFWPAASTRTFEIFLLGYFVLAGGMTILQVAANPYVSVLGDAKTASSRLNLSQAFNSVGTTIAPMIGAMFILSDNILTGDEIGALGEAEKLTYYAGEASAVQGPFIALAGSLLLLAGLVAVAKLPQVLNTKTTGGYGEAFKNSKLVKGAIGIFVYVGAEVAIGSYLVNYFMDANLISQVRETPILNNLAEFLFKIFGKDPLVVDDKGYLGIFVTLYWGGAMIGRFIGSYLTSIVAPGKVLGAFSIGALSLVTISMMSGGLTSMISILAVGLFNSIMFPTIFTIAIEDLGDLKPQGSGILCTAIAGGAFIPPLYGYFTDIAGFKTAFILVLICYGYILMFGLKSKPAATIN